MSLHAVKDVGRPGGEAEIFIIGCTGHDGVAVECDCKAKPLVILGIAGGVFDLLGPFVAVERIEMNRTVDRAVAGSYDYRFVLDVYRSTKALSFVIGDKHLLLTAPGGVSSRVEVDRAFALRCARRSKWRTDDEVIAIDCDRYPKSLNAQAVGGSEYLFLVPAIVRIAEDSNGPLIDAANVISWRPDQNGPAIDRDRSTEGVAGFAVRCC